MKMLKAVICYALERDHLPQLKTRLEFITQGISDAGGDSYAHVRDGQQWQFHNEPIKDILDRSFEMLRKCDIVILDLTVIGTSRRVGLNIEAGFAKALGKGIIALRHKSDRPNMTTDLADMEVCYETVSEIRERIRNAVQTFTLRRR